MNRQEKESRFSEILDILQTVKNGIVSDCTSELMLTGVMPQSAQQELKVLSDITGAVFVGLNALGIPLEQDANHDGLVTATVDGKVFSCAKVNLDFDKVKAPLTASEAYSVTQAAPVTSEKPAAPAAPVVEPEPVVTAPPVQNEPEVETEEDDEIETEASYTPTSGAHLYDMNEEEFDEEFEDDEIESSEEVPSFATEQKNEAEEEVEIEDDEIESDDVEDDEIEETTSSEPTVSAYEEIDDEIEEDDEIEADDEMESSEPPAAPVYEKPKANVIGGGPVSTASSGFSKNDIFIEEQSKFASEFVYHTSKISVLHPDIGSRPEEMLIMIAPLKITKYSCPSVPIIVTIFHRGNSVTASSYDTMDSGKNLVMIDIDEYYFLCRGSFDDNGNFKASIVTTGPSANQGDRINILSSKTYGNGANRETRNGHIKFRYEAESGPGTIEVFPFGKPDEDDFVAIVKNDEFVDYYFISRSLRINSRPIVYTGNGNKQELICQWEGDSLTAELVER